jgi:tyrosine-protein phosphatase SIW14
MAREPARTARGFSRNQREKLQPTAIWRIILDVIVSEASKGQNNLMRIYRRSLGLLFLFCTPAFAGLPVQGIENFHQVDKGVYRGAQPTSDGFEYLAKIGVKTVLDLRENDKRSNWEKALVTEMGMKYINVPMSGLTPPTSTEITRILVLLEAPTGGPVFVHCMRGADQTGAVIAAYRIEHDHWQNRRALEEAMSLGMSFYQLPRQRFIRKFQPLPSMEAPKAATAIPAKEDSSRLPGAIPE